MHIWCDHPQNKRIVEYVCPSGSVTLGPHRHVRVVSSGEIQSLAGTEAKGPIVLQLAPEEVSKIAAIQRHRLRDEVKRLAKAINTEDSPQLVAQRVERIVRQYYLTGPELGRMLVNVETPLDLMKKLVARMPARELTDDEAELTKQGQWPDFNDVIPAPALPPPRRQLKAAPAPIENERPAIKVFENLDHAHREKLKTRVEWREEGWGLKTRALAAELWRSMRGDTPLYPFDQTTALKKRKKRPKIVERNLVSGAGDPQSA
ncbi:MAG: hypothetical protein AB1898_27685 [Acidobacteriota bacterium]